MKCKFICIHLLFYFLCCFAYLSYVNVKCVSGITVPERDCSASPYLCSSLSLPRISHWEHPSPFLSPCASGVKESSSLLDMGVCVYAHPRRAVGREKMTDNWNCHMQCQNWCRTVKTEGEVFLLLKWKLAQDESLYTTELPSFKTSINRPTIPLPGDALCRVSTKKGVNFCSQSAKKTKIVPSEQMLALNLAVKKYNWLCWKEQQW